MSRDRLIAAGLLVAAWAEQLAGGRDQLVLHMALAGLFTLPIALAARWPWLPATACAAGLIAHGALGQEPDVTAEILALAAAACLTGSRLQRRPALVVLAALSAAAVVHLALLDAAADSPFLIGVFLAPPFLLGLVLRDRRMRVQELRARNRELTEQRERSAQLAAEIERARILEDLERVVAAGLDVMIDLSGRGEALVTSDPAAAAAVFERIRAEGAEATAELRRLLRLLHA